MGVFRFGSCIKIRSNQIGRFLWQDRALIETDAFGEAWERAVQESVRSKDPKPHAQDLILQAQDWGFQLSDIRPKPAKRSLLSRIFLFFRSSEMPGFSGPIHIFHVRHLDHVSGCEFNFVCNEYKSNKVVQLEYFAKSHSSMILNSGWDFPAGN